MKLWSLLHPPTSCQESKGTRNCEDALDQLGPWNWSLLGPPSEVPVGSEEAAGILDDSGGLGHQPWDPSFTSHALKFQDRLLKPKVGPRLPSIHYTEVCRIRDADLSGSSRRIEALEEAGSLYYRHTAQ